MGWALEGRGVIRKSECGSLCVMWLLAETCQPPTHRRQQPWSHSPAPTEKVVRVYGRVCACVHTVLLSHVQPYHPNLIFAVECWNGSRWRTAELQDDGATIQSESLLMSLFSVFKPPSVKDLQRCYCWQFRSLVCTSKVRCPRHNSASTII